jgi:NADPH:quinone reductase-like Zn-dependent oxidoreductase
LLQPRSQNTSAPKSSALRPRPKHAELRALGADHLIDYRTEDFETRTREITNGRGVELILDAVGGESWKKGYRLLAPTGRLIMRPTVSAARDIDASLFNDKWVRVPL